MSDDKSTCTPGKKVFPLVQKTNNDIYNLTLSILTMTFYVVTHSILTTTFCVVIAQAHRPIELLQVHERIFLSQNVCIYTGSEHFPFLYTSLFKYLTVILSIVNY